MNTILNRSKKGIALVMILIIFAVISIIGTTMLTIAVSQSKQTTHGISYDKAYYLARSAVDVVATDLKDRFDHLADLKSQIDHTTTEADYVTKLAEYNSALNFINNNIIDHTVTLTNANGSVANQVQISNQGDIIYIESEMSKDGATAKAKVNFAVYSSVRTSVTVTSTSSTTTTTGDDVFYTWGDINVKNNATINGNISHTGTATFNKTPSMTGTNSTVAAYPIHVQVPPASVWSDSMGTTPTVSLPATGTISSSGYYKASYGNNALEWVVDTSAHDVTLVFNSISSEKKSSIVVSGSHNLYIYLLQENDPTKPLIYMKNDFVIKNQDPSDTTPHTYIISYDKKMRNHNYVGENSFIDINNSPKMQAFFYMPYTDFTVKNNLVLSGCLYAANIDIKNNMGTTFIAPADTNFGANNITQHTEEITTPVTHNYYYDQYVVDKKWVK